MFCTTTRHCFVGVVLLQRTYLASLTDVSLFFFTPEYFASAVGIVTWIILFLFHNHRATSGGSSIEADKALPYPQSPRSNTLQYFTFNIKKCGAASKKIIFLNLKHFLASKF